jgi:hypothetical protein
MGMSGQRHAPAAIYPRERTPRTHCTGGWVGPRAGLDTENREKNPLPLPGIEHRSPGRPDRSQTLYCLSSPGSKKKIYSTIIQRTCHLCPFITFCRRASDYWDWSPWPPGLDVCLVYLCWKPGNPGLTSGFVRCNGKQLSSVSQWCEENKEERKVILAHTWWRFEANISECDTGAVFSTLRVLGMLESYFHSVCSGLFSIQTFCWCRTIEWQPVPCLLFRRHVACCIRESRKLSGPTLSFPLVTMNGEPLELPVWN